MLSTGLECFLEGWNAFYSVAMLSTELKDICTGSKCFLQGCHAFHIVGGPFVQG
jgi:hypothetical protein